MKNRKNANVEGIMWGEGTIANVRWGGVQLRDLLLRAGITEDIGQEDLHVCFGSHSMACEEEDWYGSSVPLAKALSESGDVLVAYEVGN